MPSSFTRSEPIPLSPFINVLGRKEQPKSSPRVEGGAASRRAGELLTPPSSQRAEEIRERMRDIKEDPGCGYQDANHNFHRIAVEKIDRFQKELAGEIPAATPTERRLEEIEDTLRVMRADPEHPYNVGDHPRHKDAVATVKELTEELMELEQATKRRR